MPDAARPDASQIAAPGLEELSEVRSRGGFEPVANALALGAVANRVQPATHELETQINQVGIEYIDLAIVADPVDISFAISVPDLISAHAEFPG